MAFEALLKSECFVGQVLLLRECLRKDRPKIYNRAYAAMQQWFLYPFRDGYLNIYVLTRQITGINSLSLYSQLLIRSLRPQYWKTIIRTKRFRDQLQIESISVYVSYRFRRKDKKRENNDVGVYSRGGEKRERGGGEWEGDLSGRLNSENLISF
jgi:hypothetical protein